MPILTPSRITPSSISFLIEQFYIMAVHADLFGYFCLIYLDEVFIVKPGKHCHITFMSLPVKLL